MGLGVGICDNDYIVALMEVLFGPELELGIEEEAYSGVATV